MLSRKADRPARASRPSARGSARVYFAGIPMLGSVVGWPIGISLVLGNLDVLRRMSVERSRVQPAAVGADQRDVLPLLLAARRAACAPSMRANEAQLRLLQGQMEPHFLFNTLANVISLIDADAPRAKHMLEALTDYLRASLGGLRHDDSTLGAELELARRYLQLMQTRMGERLRFEIDVDDALRQRRADAAGAAAADRERRQARAGAAGRRRHRARDGDARRRSAAQDVAAGLHRGRRRRPRRRRAPPAPPRGRRHRRQRHRAGQPARAPAGPLRRSRAADADRPRRTAPARAPAWSSRGTSPRPAPDPLTNAIRHRP